MPDPLPRDPAFRRFGQPPFIPWRLVQIFSASISRTSPILQEIWAWRVVALCVWVLFAAIVIVVDPGVFFDCMLTPPITVLFYAIHPTVACLNLLLDVGTLLASAILRALAFLLSALA